MKKLKIHCHFFSEIYDLKLKKKGGETREKMAIPSVKLICHVLKMGYTVGKTQKKCGKKVVFSTFFALLWPYFRKSDVSNFWDTPYLTLTNLVQLLVTETRIRPDLSLIPTKSFWNFGKTRFCAPNKCIFDGEKMIAKIWFFLKWKYKQKPIKRTLLQLLGTKCGFSAPFWS